MKEKIQNAFQFLLVAAWLVSIIAMTPPATVKVAKVDVKKSNIVWVGKKTTGEHSGNISLSDGSLNVENGKLKGGNFDIDLKSIVVTDVTDKEGYKTLNFSFPDLNDNLVSIKDDKYKGKVTIVEIIGTWCPNCTDQTRFLAPWFSANKNRGVEAIAIGFEQKDDLEYAKYTLGKLKSYFNIEYDIVFGGIADKKVATQKLQGLNYMAAFPTTIIFDRKGEVREIYTGYTGEITGKYFKDYVKKFNKTLDELIAEPNPFENNTINKSTTSTASSSR